MVNFHPKLDKTTQYCPNQPEIYSSLIEKKIYQDLERKTSYLSEGVSKCAEERGIPRLVSTNRPHPEGSGPDD